MAARSQRMLRVSILFLLIYVISSLIYYFVDIYVNVGAFDFNQMVSGEIYTNYYYTLGESLLDFDKFIGELWGSLVFCLFTSAYLIMYGKSSEDIKNGADYKQLSKKAGIFGILAAGIFIFCLIGSLLNLGLSRAHLDGESFQILLGNFYPEHFSEQIISYLFFGLGFVVLPYLGIRNIQKRKKLWKPNLSGLKYLFLGLIIVEFCIILFPIQPEYFITGNSILEWVFSLLQTLFIVSIIGLIETKELQGKEAVESAVPSEINSEESDIIPENKKEKEPSFETESDNIKKSGNPIIDFIKNVPEADPRLKIHTMRYFAIFLTLLAAYTLSFIIIEPFSDFGFFRYAQTLWIMLFRVFLVLFIYYFDSHLTKTKLLEEGNLDE
jgi:hypothetical protein